MSNSSTGISVSSIVVFDRKINKIRRQLEKLKRDEKRSRVLWTKKYHAFLSATDALIGLKRHGTGKEVALKEKVRNWRNESASLTRGRDDIRHKISKTEQVLVSLGAERLKHHEQLLNEVKNTDEIVTQVFALNATVVRAAKDREDCLSRHVFPRLVDAQGNLRSQISFTGSDGLRRVVAMVNTMTIVQGDLASEAKAEIQSFFERFESVTKLNERVQPLYDLTRQLLVEKTDFKVGPDLYRFLAIELDTDVFPELSRAQMLLRSSIRSEKTTSYIRIYRRDSRTSKWVVVPQS